MNRKKLVEIFCQRYNAEKSVLLENKNKTDLY